jgi:hypothetical protein
MIQFNRWNDLRRGPGQKALMRRHYVESGHGPFPDGDIQLFRQLKNNPSGNAV